MCINYMGEILVFGTHFLMALKRLSHVQKLLNKTKNYFLTFYYFLLTQLKVKKIKKGKTEKKAFELLINWFKVIRGFE